MLVGFPTFPNFNIAVPLRLNMIFLHSTEKRKLRPRGIDLSKVTWFEESQATWNGGSLTLHPCSNLEI